MRRKGLAIGQQGDITDITRVERLSTESQKKEKIEKIVIEQEYLAMSIEIRF